MTGDAHFTKHTLTVECIRNNWTDQDPESHLYDAAHEWNDVGKRYRLKMRPNEDVSRLDEAKRRCGFSRLIIDLGTGGTCLVPHWIELDIIRFELDQRDLLDEYFSCSPLPTIGQFSRSFKNHVDNNWYRRDPDSEHRAVHWRSNHMTHWMTVDMLL